MNEPESNILNCPFCGDDPIQKDGLINCENLDCPMPIAWMTPEQWNTRAESAELTQLKQQLAEVSEALDKAGAATGNEHEKYTLPKRVEWLGTGNAYVNRALDEARQQLAEAQKREAAMRAAIPFPELKASSADAMAWHAEQGKHDGGIAPAALALWLRETSKQLTEFASACKSDTQSAYVPREVAEKMAEDIRDKLAYALKQAKKHVSPENLPIHEIIDNAFEGYGETHGTKTLPQDSKNP